LQRLCLEPLADAARLGAAGVAEQTLRAAIPQPEIGRVANAGFSGGVAKQYSAAAGAQQV
jgi:hypothetical protein